MLGSSLCQLYHDEHDVFAFHRDKKCFSNCSKNLSLNLMNSSQLHYNLKQITPDLLIHCAALINIDLCEKEPEIAYQANVKTTENLGKFSPKNTKFVYISTDQVYGDLDIRSEKKSNLLPLNQYGTTKLQGEQKIENLCEDHIILRTNIFGWNVKPNRESSAEWMYKCLRKGEILSLFTDYFFSPIYTRFLGEIILQLVEKNFSGIINIGSPIPCSKYEFAFKLCEKFGFDKSLLCKGSISNFSFLAKRPKNLSLNTEKISSLGINVPDYKESINYFFENHL